MYVLSHRLWCYEQSYSVGDALLNSYSWIPGEKHQVQSPSASVFQHMLCFRLRDSEGKGLAAEALAITDHYRPTWQHGQPAQDEPCLPSPAALSSPTALLNSTWGTGSGTHKHHPSEPKRPTRKKARHSPVAIISKTMRLTSRKRSRFQPWRRLRTSSSSPYLSKAELRMRGLRVRPALLGWARRRWGFWKIVELSVVVLRSVQVLQHCVAKVFTSLRESITLRYKVRIGITEKILFLIGTFCVVCFLVPLRGLCEMEWGWEGRGRAGQGSALRVFVSDLCCQKGVLSPFNCMLLLKVALAVIPCLSEVSSGVGWWLGASLGVLIFLLVMEWLFIRGTSFFSVCALALVTW